MLLQLMVKLNQNLGSADKPKDIVRQQFNPLFNFKDTSKVASTENDDNLKLKQDNQPANDPTDHCTRSEEIEKTIEKPTCNANSSSENQDNMNDNNVENQSEDQVSEVHIVKIRDFAYPESSPLHKGLPLKETQKRRASQISVSSANFPGRHARVLYDFEPEMESEVRMRAGDTVWIQYRQCDGWFVADVGDETGLIPESYVEFI